MNSQKDESKSLWIWYPGDFEIRLHEKMSIKRRARDVMYPVFWRLDRHYSNIQFRYTYDLPEEETVKISAEGEFSLYLDGKDNFRFNDSILTLPAGCHEIRISVFNDTDAPALFIEGQHVYTNSSWQVTSYQNEWKQVGSWTFDSLENRPSCFRLETVPQEPVSEQLHQGFPLFDFGRETFGYLRFHRIKGFGAVRIFYGESLAEALSSQECYSLDQFQVKDDKTGPKNGREIYTVKEAKAFRYVWIQADPEITWERISMLYEYVPVKYQSSFECSDPRINEIYNMSLYTLHLNTREFFIDGIKRDRWVWSGDAYQSFLMNYYSFFDLDVTRRTLIALRGKDPLVMHCNTILDYSLYWFVSIYDYYQYTGDLEFIEQYYDRAVTLMEFCLAQRNPEGLLEGRPEDWVFVDWAGFENTGAVSSIQLLLARSLESMSLFAHLLGYETDSVTYGKLSSELKDKTIELFWDDTQGGLLHHRTEGVTRLTLTKHASIFALAYDYLTAEQRHSIIQNVMLNAEVPKIRTPYMRFHELAVLCENGQHEHVLSEIRSYWGGMIELGATTFWEEYDPSLKNDAHYGMYGVTFGKSLCHAWGASPIYLIGKYFLGITPLSPGYESYSIQPNLGGLEHMKGTVPTGKGKVTVEMDGAMIRVESTYGLGTLSFVSADIPECAETEVVSSGRGWYKVNIEPEKVYMITYKK
ncbi:alpha-rhamnosidase [Paenibacillus sp. ACRRY]|uniref:alpha-L-rhamnosidase-related protein n=1 Tax=Paenibacillus sp. ACRRY TaxID=2918208 RepID=UPI001EF478B9|nr:alpha-rhamnosidase [Paenibacillus sp. ACRRY]MCG7384665.1 alpha-rhamnosidase [Paenibacillus sp. ACRRY]